jgi:cytochrome c553
MKFLPRITNVLLLVVAVLTLASCTCGDREERVAKAKERQGMIIDNFIEPEPLSPGAQLYRDKTCHTCHGENGIKGLLPNYPVIAQQGEEYAYKQMLDIKSGNRSSGQSAAMKPIIATVSDEDIALLATYIATELGAGMPIGRGDADVESVGGQLFKKKTCWACHGKDGKTPVLAAYPRIAGHTAEYSELQMLEIKSGARANSKEVMGMKGIMHLVTEEDIKHLADYIAGMPR